MLAVALTDHTCCTLHARLLPGDGQRKEFRQRNYLLQRAYELESTFIAQTFFVLAAEGRHTTETKRRYVTSVLIARLHRRPTRFVLAAAA